MNEKMKAEAKQIKEKFDKYNKRRDIFIILNFFFIIVFLIVGLTLGAYDISFFDTIKCLLGGGESVPNLIIWRIRMPRVFSAFLAGMALALAGVSMQTILRNPLGSPFTLGLSQAAVFGVSFAIIVLGAGSIHSDASDAVIISNPYSATLFAFLFSLLSTAIILLLVKFKNARPETMILTGVILGSLFGSLTTAMQYFATDVLIA